MWPQATGLLLGQCVPPPTPEWLPSQLRLAFQDSRKVKPTCKMTGMTANDNHANPSRPLLTVGGGQTLWSSRNSGTRPQAAPAKYQLWHFPDRCSVLQSPRDCHRSVRQRWKPTR